jgi:lipoprotein-anchoring transpeptidase ErfK/SrfK
VNKPCHLGIVAALGTLIAAAAFSAACADPFAFFNQPNFNPPTEPAQASAYAGPGDEEVQPQFRRRIVDYRTSEAPGTIIVDTPNTYLYLVLVGGKAVRYGIGVGREGFT